MKLSNLIKQALLYKEYFADPTKFPQQERDQWPFLTMALIVEVLEHLETTPSQAAEGEGSAEGVTTRR